MGSEPSILNPDHMKHEDADLEHMPTKNRNRNGRSRTHIYSTVQYLDIDTGPAASAAVFELQGNIFHPMTSDALPIEPDSTWH